MFGIGLPEMIVILAVALIVVGPDKLPELAKSLGKALSELKQSAEELKAGFAGDNNPKQLLDEFKPDLEEVAQTFQDTLMDLPQNTPEKKSAGKQESEKNEPLSPDTPTIAPKETEAKQTTSAG